MMTGGMESTEESQGCSRQTTSSSISSAFYLKIPRTVILIEDWQTVPLHTI